MLPSIKGVIALKFPCLVDKRFCNTSVTVTLDNYNMNEDGELEPLVILHKKCNLQMGANANYTKDKEKVAIIGKALFIGDLCPSLDVITSGTVRINGNDYSINKGTKNLNPDGSVNYTTLELI